MREDTAAARMHMYAEYFGQRDICVGLYRSGGRIVLFLFEFPIPFIAPPFYELDFSEIPALFGMPMDVILSMGTEINGNINSITTFVCFAVAACKTSCGGQYTYDVTSAKWHTGKKSI